MFTFIFRKKSGLMCQVNPLPSRGFTWNIKSYFLWKTMKKYLGMLSAAVVIGALRVKNRAKSENNIDNYGTPTGTLKRSMQVTHKTMGGGRVVRWCWVNFQCRGVLQFDYSRARAYCACSRCGWGLFGHFYSHLSFLLFGRRPDIDWNTVSKGC